ncbi:isoprenylcysteine carboxylmethyltransferase family protein [Phenylobacterium sp. J367]|uniref:methyltransferase family protein n=1 Tax=Phenylobacterium sp. J367 TaxID=2898435 RepID=UPI0021518488|nr:methyltransferase [Phenylobacterium sp. J367]MCR5879916.1 isoprenylcysteine carboxyl methyltransferase [Phenylobacterium sp. J367]
MSRGAASLLTLVFLLVVPGTFAVYLPWAIAGGEMGPPFLGTEATRWLGWVMVAAGAAVVVEAQARFVWQGFGTPAPIAPPSRLVVGGFYRFVRNPMYVAVVTLTLGEALIYAEPWILAYAAALAAGFHAFIRLYEEPTLRRKFPADYPAFLAAVPRWLPRLTPWRG